MVRIGFAQKCLFVLYRGVYLLCTGVYSHFDWGCISILHWGYIFILHRSVYQLSTGLYINFAQGCISILHRVYICTGMYIYFGQGCIVYSLIVWKARKPDCIFNFAQGCIFMLHRVCVYFAQGYILFDCLKSKKTCTLPEQLSRYLVALCSSSRSLTSAYFMYAWKIFCLWL